MTPEPSQKHAPVNGDVIARSAMKTIGGLLFAGLMFCGSAVVVWAYFADFALPLPSASVKINVAGAIVGGLGLVIAPLLMLYFGFMLVVQERIVLGDDRLQILQHWKGVDKVIAQIPYRNILRTQHGNDEGVRYLGIDLVKADDPDSFHSGSNFVKEKNTYGWHFRLLGGYAADLPTIHDRLTSKLQASKPK